MFWGICLTLTTKFDQCSKMVSGGSVPSGVAAAPAMSAELAGLYSEAGVAPALVKWCEQTGILTVRNLGNFCDSADQVADRIVSASGLYSNDPADKSKQREFNMQTSFVKQAWKEADAQV